MAHSAITRALTALSLMLVAVTPALAGGNCFWEIPPASAAFGTYSVFATGDVRTTVMFSITCKPGFTGQIWLSPGGASSFTPREMTSGGDPAAYNFYLDPAGTQIWGDTTSSSTSYEVFNATKADRTFTDFIYGIVPAGQDLASGTYTDTIIATLHWDNKAGNKGAEVPVTFTVTMTVNPECRVDSFAVDFGTYDPFAPVALNRSTLLKVYCTRLTAANLLLNNGSNPSGPQRRMFDGSSNYLAYDAALGATSGTSASSIVPLSGGVPVNCSLSASQDVPVGGYRDTLVATVNY